MLDPTHWGACDLTCDSNYYCASANHCANGNSGIGFGYWKGPAQSCTSYCVGKGTCLSSTLDRLDGSSTSYRYDDVDADAADGSRAGTLTVPNVGTILDCLCGKPAHR